MEEVRAWRAREVVRALGCQALREGGEIHPWWWGLREVGKKTVAARRGSPCLQTYAPTCSTTC